MGKIRSFPLFVILDKCRMCEIKVYCFNFYSILQISHWCFHEANDWMLLQVISDKKACKNDKPTKPPSLSVSPLQNKNDIFSPKSKSKTSKKDLKSSSGGTIPIHMLNVPLNFKTWSDQRILWNALPSTINNLGKVWFMF